MLGELFERQVNAGDATRASLTYKKLARHGSPTWEQKFRFGQLLEGSNKKLAAGTYEAALGDLAKLNKKKEALQILDRIVALEPVQTNLLRLAELSSEVGERKAAAGAFKQVAQLAAASGDDAAPWYERGLSGRFFRSGDHAGLRQGACWVKGRSAQPSLFWSRR